MMTPQVEPRNGTRALHPEELSEFEELLRRRKALLADDVLGLERAWTDHSEMDGAHSNHMAESGSDSFEEDVRLARMESAGEEIEEIEAALERVRDGAFGTCEECGKAISLERLRAIPYARLCIPCKQVEETA
jgi:RNA polymerase-binding transcription factor DksA